MSANYTVKIRAWDGLFDIQCVCDDKGACSNVVLRHILEEALEFIENESTSGFERTLQEVTWRNYDD